MSYQRHNCQDLLKGEFMRYMNTRDSMSNLTESNLEL